MSPEHQEPLSRAFYEKSVLEVARSLIGHYLVRDWNGERLVGRVVETEAYAGRVDPSSHAFRGPTDRCRAMFGPVGHAYVYFTYGNHHCLNVTAGPRKLAGAVLVRAVEPVAGIATLRRLRAAAAKPGATRTRIERGRGDPEIANGPGKLAAAFGIDLDLNGLDLTLGSRLWLARGRRASSVSWTPRVGLGKNLAAPWFWRCVDATSQGLTRLPQSWPRATRPEPTLKRLTTGFGRKI